MRRLDRNGLGLLARLSALALSAGLAGCTPEGSGTIEVGKPDAVRSKIEPGGATPKPESEKQAKAIQAEEEAAKKHPKLR